MAILKVVPAVLLLVAVSLPVDALEVKEQVLVAASPDAAWRAIGDFCGIAAWHPAVAKCELSRQDGTTYRTLALNGGGTLIERMLAWDTRHRKYSYGIVDGPLPVARYRSTIAVEKTAKGTIIRWSGVFDAKDASDSAARQAISGIYTGGLNTLAERLSGHSR